MEVVQGPLVPIKNTHMITRMIKKVGLNVLLNYPGNTH